MQSIRNMLHSNKRHSAAVSDAPTSARPSTDKAADKTTAEHHEGSHYLAPPAPAHRGHRRNLSEATAATASARSSMDITPADAAEAQHTQSKRSSRRASQQIEWEQSLPGMKPPMARTVDHAGRVGFTSSNVMGYEGLGHDVL